jgi:hypothetical protein
MMRLPAGRARNRDWFRIEQEILLFFRAFRMVLGFTQSPIQSVPGVRGSKMRPGVKLSNHSHQVPKLRLLGTISNPAFFRGLKLYQLYIGSVVFLLCNKFDSRFQWPRGLRRKSAAACLLRFQSHRGHRCLSAVCVVFCQVKVSATSWSLVQRSPTDCGASLWVI